MSSSNKRERELARDKYERQQQRRIEREAQRKQRNRVLAVVAGLVVVLGAVAVVVLSSRGDSAPAASPSISASASASASSSASASPSGSASTAPVKGCTTAPAATTKTATWPAPGGTSLPTDTPTFLSLTTNCGEIVLQMDPAAAPKTTQSMAFLAAQAFYTDSDCFRLTTKGIFVLQCGSPTNNGQGGPGYSIPDENLPKDGANNYPAGTVAMANAGAGTGGSQFFIVYKDTTLGPNYTIWGKVVSGLDVVTRVAAAGEKTGAGDGAPNQKIVITKASTRATQAG